MLPLRVSRPVDQEAERRALLALVRSTGAQGGRIDPHRAIATIDLSTQDRLLAVLLTVGVTGGYVASLGALGRLWSAAFRWLAPQLALGGVAHRTESLAGLVQVSVPYFTASAPAPGAMAWWVTLAGTLLVVAVSFTFRASYLPLGYALRFASAIQASALLYFAVAPERFPYDLANYVSGMMLVGMVIIGIVPLVLGLTYYVIDVAWQHKLALTLLVMLHLAVFVPLQYALHSVVIVHGTLIMMPLSFIMFGMLPEVMVLIALYGWGMSWRPFRARGRRQ
jgi:hypothetical protein